MIFLHGGAVCLLDVIAVWFWLLWTWSWVKIWFHVERQIVLQRVKKHNDP